jgi:periplasmic divalent cation tolerance protein
MSFMETATPEYVVVLITTATPEEGRRIAQALVADRLAACVNIISPIESVYRWQAQVHQERESLLMVKTVRDRVARLTQRVKELHSFQVPEVVALPICAGPADYLHWISEQTTTDG